MAKQAVFAAATTDEACIVCDLGTRREGRRWLGMQHGARQAWTVALQIKEGLIVRGAARVSGGAN
ncbi:hypothetical protein E2562_036471 [Oryza meyeriana var. granulata]|uniref:Uncharacterized protein n=1 Tax=Oryza meyeriana var. granulata TaxID=110450 RepID=A0A6G1C1U2_9ORYZ|nr:hypothetical protein E2562_036471 [Oryza meyeriana var. granulata]